MVITSYWSGTIVKEYKLLQRIFYATLLTDEFDDDIDKLDVTIKDDKDDEQFIASVKHYILDETAPLVFPCKSYAVAVIYAKLIAKYFNEDFYDVLSDPELMFNNDRFFIPYSRDMFTYNAILNDLNVQVELENIEQSTNPNHVATVKYFKQEFMIDGELYIPR
jgi:hypothetical protein